MTDDEPTGGLDGSGLAEALGYFHPSYPLTNFHGYVMPVSLFPAAASEQDDLETPLGSIEDGPAFAEDYYASDWDDQHHNRQDLQRHLGEAKEKGRWNGLTYAMSAMTVNTCSVRIDCKLGRYFQNLLTSDSMDLELALALARTGGEPIDPTSLTRRSWLAARAADPVLDGRNRSTALSVACTVIVRRRNGFTLFLAPRARNVARHQFFNHVAPAGILQPPRSMETQWQQWFSVRSNLLREFAEELYTTSTAALEDEIRSDGVEGVPEVARLLSLVSDGGARLLYTGVSVNMLMLRPEVCTLLYVEDEEWLARERSITAGSPRAFAYSDEYIQFEGQEALPHGRQYLQHLDLDDGLEPLNFKSELRPSALVPNAAGAITLATKVLRERQR